jgi:pSer/pThr/pTyr-binding forkhead associated (FHA) protein
VKIEDSGSTNGTFVNDVRLAAGQRVEIRDGDRIRFGLFSAVVKII